MTTTVPQTPVFMKVPSACFLKLPADGPVAGIWLNLAAVRRIAEYTDRVTVEYDDGRKDIFDGKHAIAILKAIGEMPGTIDKS